MVWAQGENVEVVSVGIAQILWDTSTLNWTPGRLANALISHLPFTEVEGVQYSEIYPQIPQCHSWLTSILKWPRNFLPSFYIQDRSPLNWIQPAHDHFPVLYYAFVIKWAFMERWCLSEVGKSRTVSGGWMERCWNAQPSLCAFEYTLLVWYELRGTQGKKALITSLPCLPSF